MEGRDYITKFISPEQLGIEIAPWFKPFAPKKNGYRSLALDIFDTKELRRRGEADPNVNNAELANIEEVDLVGSATDIVGVVGKKYALGTFDYIISSHNFEHLPDPIRFLQGCEKILKPGGVLSMLIPQRRSCYDYFRPNTTLADMLEAYFERRERPKFTQVFEVNSLHCRYINDQGYEDIGFSIYDDPMRIKPLETLNDAYKSWQEYNAKPDNEYRDTHCWVGSPASLELILRDLQFLGLLNLEIIEIADMKEAREFGIHLRNRTPSEVQPLIPKEFYQKRRELLYRAHAEAAVNLVSYNNPLVSGNRLVMEIENLKDSLRTLKNSTSWRITAPLRKLVMWSRRLRRRLSG